MANSFTQYDGETEAKIQRALQAQFEALGIDRRQRISEDDYKENLKRVPRATIEANRRYNQSGTEESRVSKDVKSGLSSWSNAWTELNDDTTNGLEDMNSGQTHRATLSVRVAENHYDERDDFLPPGRRGGKSGRGGRADGARGGGRSGSRGSRHGPARIAKGLPGTDQIPSSGYMSNNPILPSLSAKAAKITKIPSRTDHIPGSGRISSKRSLARLNSDGSNFKGILADPETFMAMSKNKTQAGTPVAVSSDHKESSQPTNQDGLPKAAFADTLQPSQDQHVSESRDSIYEESQISQPQHKTSSNSTPDAKRPLDSDIGRKEIDDLFAKIKKRRVELNAQRLAIEQVQLDARAAPVSMGVRDVKQKVVKIGAIFGEHVHKDHFHGSHVKSPTDGLVTEFSNLTIQERSSSVAKNPIAESTQPAISTVTSKHTMRDSPRLIDNAITRQYSLQSASDEQTLYASTNPFDQQSAPSGRSRAPSETTKPRATSPFSVRFNTAPYRSDETTRPRNGKGGPAPKIPDFLKDVVSDSQDVGAAARRQYSRAPVKADPIAHDPSPSINGTKSDLNGMFSVDSLKGPAITSPRESTTLEQERPRVKKDPWNRARHWVAE